MPEGIIAISQYLVRRAGPIDDIDVKFSDKVAENKGR
jgi:hypothetical protein